MLAIASLDCLQINEVSQCRFVQHVLLDTAIDHLDTAYIANDRGVRDINLDFGMFRKQRFETAFELVG